MSCLLFQVRYAIRVLKNKIFWTAIILQDLQQFDDSKVCGRVWKHNFLAYRCKTCALSPCMSLCNECFHLGDHKGHDYNMFRSQAGGACDCGDENVLLPSG